MDLGWTSAFLLDSLSCSYHPGLLWKGDEVTVDCQALRVNLEISRQGRGLLIFIDYFIEQRLVRLYLMPGTFLEIGDTILAFLEFTFWSIGGQNGAWWQVTKIGF